VFLCVLRGFGSIWGWYNTVFGGFWGWYNTDFCCFVGVIIGFAGICGNLWEFWVFFRVFFGFWWVLLCFGGICCFS